MMFLPLLMFVPVAMQPGCDQRLFGIAAYSHLALMNRCWSKRHNNGGDNTGDLSG